VIGITVTAWVFDGTMNVVPAATSYGANPPLPEDVVPEGFAAADAETAAAAALADAAATA